MPRTLYMVIEHYKNADPRPVYRRFRDHGRLAPDGLMYVSSWVDHKFERCYQLMETDDRARRSAGHQRKAPLLSAPDCNDPGRNHAAVAHEIAGQLLKDRGRSAAYRTRNQPGIGASR